MKKKYKITFEIEADYPYINKYIKKMTKDFNNWLIEWSTMEDIAPIPLLFLKDKTGDPVHFPDYTIKVKIVSDGETILNTKWQEAEEE